jgi:hypothetical protein
MDEIIILTPPAQLGSLRVFCSRSYQHDHISITLGNILHIGSYEMSIRSTSKFLRCRGIQIEDGFDIMEGF